MRDSAKRATAIVVAAAFGCAGGGCETSEKKDGDKIVARADYAVAPNMLPPKILGRRFWNHLPYLSPQSSQVKAMEEHVWNEPMVRDAALVYHVETLLAKGGDGFTVNGEKLLAVQPAQDVPFMVASSAGRPPFRVMEDFRVEKRLYENWKKTYPNFMGFWAGSEWDNQYTTCLNGADAEAFARKFHCSDTAVKRMHGILARARNDKDSATAGLRACYDALRRYYFDDPEKMLFLRGAWCFDHYALAWGAGMVVLETTNTGPYRHQPSLFYTRGAARQYGKPWEWYIATFYNGFNSTGKWSVNNEPNGLGTTSRDEPYQEEHSGSACGMSVSLSRRDKYLAYFAGASFVQHEDWPRAYCRHRDGDSKEWVLAPHGESMKEWYAFTQRHPDRGASYAPVALLLPFNQGMPNHGGRPWSRFKEERPDMMIDAFMYTVAPFTQDLKNGKEGCLANGEFGDGYDVLVPDPPSGPVTLDTLLDYKVAILLGKCNVRPPLAARLMDYVRKGGTLVVNSRQTGDCFPQGFTGVIPGGKSVPVEGRVFPAGDAAVELGQPYDYEPVELAGAKAFWRDEKGGILASVNAFGRGRVVLTTVDFMLPRETTRFCASATAKAPLVELLMRRIVREVLPVGVKGDIEYGLNKVSGGWWVYLINNKGVTKFTETAETLDPSAAATVTVDLRGLRVSSARELRGDVPIAIDRERNAITVEVPPGDIRVVQITTE